MVKFKLFPVTNVPVFAVWISVPFKYKLDTPLLTANFTLLQVLIGADTVENEVLLLLYNTPNLPVGDTTIPIQRHELPPTIIGEELFDEINALALKSAETSKLATFKVLI